MVTSLSRGRILHSGPFHQHPSFTALWLPWVFSGPAAYCLQPVVQFVVFPVFYPPIFCPHKRKIMIMKGKFHTTTAWFNNPLMTLSKHQVQMPWRAISSLSLPASSTLQFHLSPLIISKSPTRALWTQHAVTARTPGILNCLRCKEEGKR